jgi:hypothetical protein
MDAITQDLARVAALGIGATAVMDAWAAALARMGIPAMNFAMVGRWAGHGLRGRWMHAAIGKAAPIPGELAMGWLVHYLVGIAFAGLLIAIAGMRWMASPSLWPALAVGIATVAAPWLLMQPAMGGGVAFSRTPSPWTNRLRSLANHAVFGLGLYAAARVMP